MEQPAINLVKRSRVRQDVPYVAAWLVISAAVWLAGCGAKPGPDRARQDPAKDMNLSPDQVAQLLEPNVVGVAAMYDAQNAWLWTKNRVRVRGLRLTLFLFGSGNKSVFGDGVIRARLFAAQRGRLGKVQWPEEPTQEWSFTVEEAIPFRGMRPKIYGWYYGLFLDWGDRDLSDKEIRMIITFERADQRVISSDARDMRVPGGK